MSFKKHRHLPSTTRSAVARKKNCNVSWKCRCRTKVDGTSGSIPLHRPLAQGGLAHAPKPPKHLLRGRHLYLTQPHPAILHRRVTVQAMFEPALLRPGPRPPQLRHTLPSRPLRPPAHTLSWQRQPLSQQQPRHWPRTLRWLPVSALCTPLNPQNRGNLLLKRAMLSKSWIVDTRTGGEASSKEGLVFSPSITWYLFSPPSWRKGARTHLHSISAGAYA